MRIIYLLFLYSMLNLNKVYRYQMLFTQCRWTCTCKRKRWTCRKSSIYIADKSYCCHCVWWHVARFFFIYSDNPNLISIFQILPLWLVDSLHGEKFTHRKILFFVRTTFLYESLIIELRKKILFSEVENSFAIFLSNSNGNCIPVQNVEIVIWNVLLWFGC